MDVQAFDDPNIAANMSVWTDLNALKTSYIPRTSIKTSCAGAKSGLIKWNFTLCFGGLHQAIDLIYKKRNYTWP